MCVGRGAVGAHQLSAAATESKGKRSAPTLVGALFLMALAAAHNAGLCGFFSRHVSSAALGHGTQSIHQSMS
jgi:hypothetical protein